MLVYFPRIFWLFFILIYLHAYSEVFATEPKKGLNSSINVDLFIAKQL